MTGSHRAPRVPTPLLGAVAVLAVAAVVLLVVAVRAFADGGWFGIFPLLGAAGQALVAAGLLRGHRAAYVAAVVIGALLVTSSFSYVDDLAAQPFPFVVRIVLGLALLGLLLAPPSARRHFVAA